MGRRRVVTDGHAKVTLALLHTSDHLPLLRAALPVRLLIVNGARIFDWTASDHIYPRFLALSLHFYYQVPMLSSSTELLISPRVRSTDSLFSTGLDMKWT